MTYCSASNHTTPSWICYRASGQPLTSESSWWGGKGQSPTGNYIIVPDSCCQFSSLVYYERGRKAAVNMQRLPQQSAFWSMIACVNVSVGYWFPGGLLYSGFIRLTRWQARPSECLIKVQLTLPVKGRGAISLPICSTKALPDMFFCSYSSSCHPGSHQCTDPNIPAFSEPPRLILEQTGPQHKHDRPATNPGLDSPTLWPFPCEILSTLLMCTFHMFCST